MSWRTSLGVSKVQHIVFKPGLLSLGNGGRHQLLKEDIWGARGHIVHPGLDHIFEHPQVQILVHLLLGLEEVGQHDMAFTADDTQDYTSGQFRSPEDHGDARGLPADPVILSVPLLVHCENFLI